ncbi:RidA family protein [Cupriavidus malaysiensis]|uniref:Enamine deaminase RidA n=1 Tax=Cupriavidus malaysiensis TaxID=367825 RepID=A0A1D9IEG6_9BURK|nr:RidA family protein [Cupriavidus malaysiensis]AOZ10403.1 enamine deaminase RidA [Cupriavidus malaysiensis]
MLQRILSTRVAAPKFAYSPCVRHGATAYVAGMVALDPDSGRLVDGGVAAQTRRIFDNLQLALPDYGLDLDALCLARAYLSDFSTFAEFNHAWESVFAGRPLPARTTLGVAALPLGAAVEIEFTFACSTAERS